MATEYKLNVYAYYYPWYTGAADNKWVTLREYSPYLGLYDSSDRDVVRRHIEWAIEFGIDGFLVEWYGRAGGGSVPLDANTELFRSVVADYPDFRFAIFYDQAIRFGGPNQLRFDDPGRRQLFLEDFTYAASTNFGHPNYLRINGRPVVVIYLTRSANGNYAALLGEAGTRMESFGYGRPFIIGDEVWWREKNRYFPALDAVTAYSLVNRTEMQTLNGGVREFARHHAELYTRVQPAATAAGTDVFPHVGQSFNDTAVGGHMPLVPTIEPGKLPEYRLDMIECMKAQQVVWRDSPRFRNTGQAYLLVNSFNEWPERTAIEPSAEIETFNKIYDFRTGQQLYLQPHRFEYLEGLRAGKRLIERNVLPNL